MVTFQVDADDENAGWTKKSWDFPSEIDSAEKMRTYIQQFMVTTVEHFKKLPVYRFNVGKISWLKDL